MSFRTLFVALVLLAGAACGPAGSQAPSSGPGLAQSPGPPQEVRAVNPTPDPAPQGLETATLGGGCFWCVEAIFKEVDGVTAVTSGYAGGHVKNPTYKEVCGGDTGHAEVVQVQFDPKKITYPEILEIFFLTHDPTTLNRQGNDVGTQYRSVVFYHSDAQRQEAEEAKQAAASEWTDPLVTEISPAPEFYAAEDYHQDYYELNPNAPYCNFVIGPKVKKFREKFKDRLKAPVQ